MIQGEENKNKEVQIKENNVSNNHGEENEIKVVIIEGNNVSNNQDKEGSFETDLKSKNDDDIQNNEFIMKETLLITDNDDVIVQKDFTSFYDLTIEDSSDDQEKEEDENTLLQILSQIKQEKPEINDEIFYISSDEEDNPWLNKLSQNSRRSPPLIKKEAEEENVEQWWPELSQEFIDEMELELCDITKQKSNELEVENTNACQNDAVENLKVQIEDKVEDEKEQLSRLEKVKSIIKIPQITKPTIIEAPVMELTSKSSKKQLSKKLSERDRKSSSHIEKKTDMQKNSSTRTEKNTDSRTNESHHSSKKIVDKEHIEKRKIKLREIVKENNEKREQQLLKNQTKYQPKEKTIPKVKLTHTSRNELFLAEMTKERQQPKPSTSKSKSTSCNFKIPKNMLTSRSESSKKTKINDSYNNCNNLEKDQKSSKINNHNNDNNSKLKSILKSISNTPNNIKKTVKFDLNVQIREFYSINLESKSLSNKINLLNIRHKNVSFSDECPPSDDIIWEITNWQTEWLTLKNNTPSVLMNKIHAPDLIYNSYEKYYNTFSSLMYLELWSLIKNEYEKTNCLAKKFECAIQNVTHSTNNLSTGKTLTYLEIILLLSKNDDMKGNHPTRGDVIIIKLSEKDNLNNENEGSRRFGYVTHIIKQPINLQHDRFELRLPTVDSPEVVLYVTVAVKYDPNIFNVYDKYIILRPTGKISGLMKQFTALQKLPLSPLCPLILNPLHPDNACVDYQLENFVSEHKLNISQIKAVQETCASCLSPEPKICLIEGPPGTGKSLVIVSLVENLLYGDNRYRNNLKSRHLLPKILLCASSNAAIDNLTLKLLRTRQKIPNKELRFRMVRIGQLDSIHPDARLISLQYLTDRQRKQNIIDEAERNSYNHKMEYMKKDTNEDITDILIKKADVVCTTLGSCFNRELERMLRIPEFRFTCCIIDEASQCPEPTSSLSILLRVNTLVLVGDSNQLPGTILSQDAKRYGYGQSLFERFQRCLNKVPENTKCRQIHFLNVQYRMHPEIVLFPNAYFYNNKILNNPNLNSTLPLIKYKLFLHDFLQDSSETNKSEANLIVNLVVAISELVQNCEIGIITPYKSQRKKIDERLKDHNIIRNHIKVATVDSFQGLEKDIIILSCVRTDKIGFLADQQRLNVALTRAKHCFYIVGNFISLQMNRMWHELKKDAGNRNCIFYIKNNEIGHKEFCQILKRQN